MCVCVVAMLHLQLKLAQFWALVDTTRIIILAWSINAFTHSKFKKPLVTKWNDRFKNLQIYVFALGARSHQLSVTSRTQFAPVVASAKSYIKNCWTVIVAQRSSRIFPVFLLLLFCCCCCYLNQDCFRLHTVRNWFRTPIVLCICFFFLSNFVLLSAIDN